MIQNDHPGNVRRGGVSSYFYESLPVRSISNPHLNGCLIFEVSANNKNNKKSYVVSLYRSTSETADEFKAFLANLEKFIFDISSGH